MLKDIINEQSRSIPWVAAAKTGSPDVKTVVRDMCTSSPLGRTLTLKHSGGGGECKDGTA